MGDAAIHVLLIEDNRGDARLIREMLADVRGVRFAVVCVDRLSMGLERLAEGGIDVVLLDLSLPDGRGLDTFVRVHAQSPIVPVVVLTGLDDEAVAVGAVREGAQDYLVKGQVDGNLLARAIRHAIERCRLQAALRGAALTDDLTGLYNRRGFFLLAEQHVKVAHRTSGEFLLVLADVDDLKRINDTFGHDEGDLALKKTAVILKRTFRDSDIIARLGGDEFAVLAIGAADDNVEGITVRVQEHLNDYGAQSNRPYTLSLSLGTARFDADRTGSLEELMAEADGALYKHKRRRREP